MATPATVEVVAVFAAVAVGAVFAVVVFRALAAGSFGGGGCGSSRTTSPAREGGACGSSRTTSVAFLSARRPWNDGWRSAPSLLHSVNAISATRSGLIQWAPLASYPRGGFTNGGLLCSRLTRSLCNIVSVR